MRRPGTFWRVFTTVATAASLAFTGSASAGATPPDDAAGLLQGAANDTVAHDGGGAIGLVRAGTEQRTVAAGYDDQFAGVKADPAAQYRIGSNTKAYVSTVLLQLEAEHKVSLDDSVAHWLPDALHGTNDGTKVSIRQLLNHTSGIYDYMEDPGTKLTYFADFNPDQAYLPQQLVDIANRNQPYFAPGQGWHYSNTNYILAGMIISKVTGNDPAPEIEKRILKPLHLTHTYLPTGDSQLHGTYMHGYELLFRDVSVSNVHLTWTAGAMVSTLSDQAEFSRALLSGKLLPPAQLKELETTVPSTDPNLRYGLGIGLMHTPCGDAWTHAGAVIGYANDWLASQNADREVVFTYNDLPGPDFFIPTLSTLSTTLSQTYCATP